MSLSAKQPANFDSSRLFVGGSLGIASASQGEYNDKANVSSFSFSPEAGYLLNNNKWIVGLRLSWTNVGCSNTRTTVDLGDFDYSFDGIYNYNAFGFKPYAMFNCFNVGPVAFWLEGSIGFDYAFNGDKDYLDAQIFNIGILPVLTWKPFEHFSFFTALDFLSFKYSYEEVLLQGHDHISSRFSIGADSDSFLSFSDISLGFRYWF